MSTSSVTKFTTGLTGLFKNSKDFGRLRTYYFEQQKAVASRLLKGFPADSVNMSTSSVRKFTSSLPKLLMNSKVFERPELNKYFDTILKEKSKGKKLFTAAGRIDGIALQSGRSKTLIIQIKFKNVKHLQKDFRGRITELSNLSKNRRIPYYIFAMRLETAGFKTV